MRLDNENLIFKHSKILTIKWNSKDMTQRKTWSQKNKLCCIFMLDFVVHDRMKNTHLNQAHYVIQSLCKKNLTNKY